MSLTRYLLALLLFCIQIPVFAIYSAYEIFTGLHKILSVVYAIQ